MLDQRELPARVTFIDYADPRAVAEAITAMVVRGAPAIGITAAYGLVLAAQRSSGRTVGELRADLAAAGDDLRRARPTAVNLFWAIDRVLQQGLDPQLETVDDIRRAVLDEAHAIYALEERSNYQIGVNALPLVPQGAKFIHHCNTGPLATGAYGTALRVIIAAHEAGKTSTRTSMRRVPACRGRA